MKLKRVRLASLAARIGIDGGRKFDAGYRGGPFMLTTRMTSVVALAVVVGASAWYLHSSGQVDVMIKTEPAVTAELAPKIVLEPIPLRTWRPMVGSQISNKKG